MVFFLCFHIFFMDLLQHVLLTCYGVLRIKISVNTDISVIGFYENIKNIGKILVDIFTKISVIKIFHILII